MAFDGNNSGSGNWLASSSTLAHGIGSGDFTIAGWWYPIATSIDNVIGLSIGSRAASQSVTLQLAGTDLKFRAFGSDGSYPFNTVLTLNAWVHLAVRKSGSTISGWVNGVQEATTWSGFALGSGSIATGNIYINGAPSAFVGKSNAAELAIWAAALSADEFKALTKRRKPPDVRLAGLKAYWPLNRETNDRWSAGLTMTAQNGTAAFVDHVPLIEELGQFVSLTASGGGGGATPWLYARRSARIIGGAV